ncbi:MAG: beta-propeller fold lactonase family protein, partial [Actinobacteria bacterium]|nr:beta-propeller fold lactonase family protein [Actinomycetota bacterium]
MSIAVQRPEPSQRPSNPDQRVAVGDMTHRSSGSRRVLAALGVVLAMLLGSAVAITAPAGADAPSFSVVATVGVGSPTAVAVSPDGSRAYVSNGSGNSVSVIDTSTNEVVVELVVGLYPSSVAVSPDGSRVYVANYDSSSVSVIDTSTNEVVATVDVESVPRRVAVSPDGSRLYLANSSDGVIVFDTSTNEVVATVAILDDYHQYIAVSPDGSRVYVGNYFDYSVSVIDTSTNEVVATVGVGSSPAGVAVSPDGS